MSVATVRVGTLSLIKKSSTLKSKRGNLVDPELRARGARTYHPAYLLLLKGAGGKDYDRIRKEWSRTSARRGSVPAAAGEAVRFWEYSGCGSVFFGR